MPLSILFIAAATDAPPKDHALALWIISIAVCVLCAILFLWLINLTKDSWKILDNQPVRSISRERAEKSCDTVLSVCSLLIPATLGLITWLNDKVGAGIYILPLLLALAFFFILLAFTIHLRFNFFWRRDADFIVTSEHNTRFAYWLTTATTAIVLGLALLSVPVLELGFGWLKFKPIPTPPPVKVDCPCKPPDLPPPPPPPPVQPPPPQPPPGPPIKHHHHHRRPPCACIKK